MLVVTRLAARRLRTLAGCLVAVAALLAGRPAVAEPLAEAGGIRSECLAARSALRRASSLPTRPNDAYRVALRDAEAHVDSAYRLADAAPWPADLPATRSSVLASLGAARSKLVRLGHSPRARKTSRVRKNLDREAVRLDNVIALLDMLVPREPPSVPAPVPPPPPAPPAPVPAPPGTIPLLVGGQGFAEVTVEPAAVGNGPGADARAIARWDVVPYQTVGSKIPVGVVAFHIAGIEAVDFSLNGGAWSRVTTMTQNPLTMVWEYSAYVDPAEVADGLFEVRAVVHPKKGLARVLAGPYDESEAAKARGEHSLFLYGNAGGTLPSRTVWADADNGDDDTGDGTSANPFRSINQAYFMSLSDDGDPSGLTVYLRPGDYQWPESWAGFKENSLYVTVAGAPDQARTAARITTINPDRNRGLDARRVCLRNLTIDTVTVGTATRGCLMWTDGCDLRSTGPAAYPWILREPDWSLGIWMTRPVIHDMGFATGEYRFMRDYEIYDIGEDAIRDLCGFAINGYVHDMRYGKPDVHSDLIQFYDGMGADGQFENIAMYGLKTRRIGNAAEGVQGLFIRNYMAVPAHEDLAFVNCEVEVAGNSQILHSVNHLLVWHCNFLPNPAAGTGGTLLLADDPPDSPHTKLHNFSLRDSALAYFTSACSPEPLVNSPPGGETWAEGNHIVVGPAVGTNTTAGAALTDLFADPASGDYTPVLAGALTGRLSELLIPADLNGRVRKAPDFVGAEVPAAK